MEMLILILAAAGLGYLLAAERVGDRVVDDLEDLGARSKSWMETAGERIYRSPLEMQLKVWALGDGAALFPRDFRDWLAALPGNEARDFALALEAFMQGLGYSPRALFQGSYAHQPERLQHYAQTILLYAQVYREAQQAFAEA